MKLALNVLAWTTLIFIISIGLTSWFQLRTLYVLHSCTYSVFSTPKLTVSVYFNNKTEFQILIIVFPSVPRIHISKKILVCCTYVTIFQIFNQSSPESLQMFNVLRIL